MKKEQCPSSNAAALCPDSEPQPQQEPLPPKYPAEPVAYAPAGCVYARRSLTCNTPALGSRYCVTSPPTSRRGHLPTSCAKSATPGSTGSRQRCSLDCGQRTSFCAPFSSTRSSPRSLASRYRRGTVCFCRWTGDTCFAACFWRVTAPVVCTIFYFSVVWHYDAFATVKT